MSRDTMLSNFLKTDHLRLVHGVKRRFEEAHRRGDVGALRDLRTIWNQYNKLLGLAEVLNNNSELVRSVVRMEAWLDSVIGK